MSRNWKNFEKHDRKCLDCLKETISRNMKVRTRGQTAEARRTTILQPVEQKPHSQKDRKDEKAEGSVPDEGIS